MLPMGTVLTVCMLIAILFAVPYAFPTKPAALPGWVAKSVAGLVFAAGAWNVFWYAVQHLSEFWGIAALVSGCLLMITAGYIAGVTWMPTWLLRAKPIVLLALLACMLKYGITIYHL